MLTLTQLSKQFDGASAAILHDVSLTLSHGESLAIMGASGSGKSTLLNMIAGLITPSSGNVTLEGENVSKLSQIKRDAWRASNLGLVFQQFNLIDCLNVEDNIALPARYLGIPEASRLDQLLNAMSISSLRHQSIEKLSGGEQQRVAIARALIHNPKLVLADEPTGNLDEETSETVCQVLFSQIRQAKAGLIVVTHSNDVAAQADRILHLRKGTLV